MHAQKWRIVQDEICKVEGMLEELGMRLQEDAWGRKDTIVQEGRVFLEGEKHVVTKGTPLLMQSGHHNNMVQQIGQGNSSSGDVPWSQL